MNILTLSWRGPGHPNAGGAEISTHEHAKGWVSAGHKVTLFTSYYNGAKKKEIVDGVAIIRYGHQVFGVQLEAIKWYLFGDHQKFDLVVDQFHGIPFFTPLFVRVKKLAFIHEVAKEVWSLNQFPLPLNNLVSFLGRPLESFIFKIYRKIDFMTVSESTKEDLIAWGISAHKITIVHNGIDSPKTKIPGKENKKTVVFLGALARDKGIEQALEVFHRLQQVYKDNIQFWVIGKGDLVYQDFLIKKSANLNLKNIKFWGYVNNSEKFKLLAKSHVLLNTSIREGWGLVVIEAATVGTPTVAFDVPGLRDSILNGKTGIIDKLISVNSIADEIINLFSDNSRYQKMREEALNWSKRFSWKKSITGSLALINKITTGATS